MKRDACTRTVAVLCVAAIAGLPVPAWGAPAATLAGRVLGQDAKTPVAGAVVKLTGTSEESVSADPTAADGSFRLTELAPGAYRVFVETDEGVYQVSSALSLEPGQTRTVQMALKKNVHIAAASARPGGGFSGLHPALKAVIGVAFLIGPVVLADAVEEDTQPASVSNPD